MIKIFSLTILLFQLTFAYAQKPYAEDEELEYYDTKWGAWVTAAGNTNISFSAKLNRYSKKTKLYNWSVRMKTTRTPIYFEYKISNEVLTPGLTTDVINENDGYYTTSIFDSKSNEQRINGSGLSVNSTSKTTLYYQIRNVCYEFDGREANCEVKNNTLRKENTKQSIDKQNEPSNTSNSLSVEDLEKNIIANLKRNLKLGSFYYKDDQYERDFDLLKINVDKDVPSFYGELYPHKLYIHYYYGGSNELFGQDFVDLKVEKIFSKGQYLLNFIRVNNANVPGVFLYDFGINDENFVELQNAIESLKNPNKNFGSSSKESVNVQKTEVVKEKEVEEKSVSKNGYVPSQKKLNSNKVANQAASFDGDWVNFLQRNFEYPDEIAAKKIQGKVIVSFMVDKVGNVSQVKGVSGPKELFQAAENLITKSNGMWIPARQNNQFVSYYLKQPISFQIEQENNTEIKSQNTNNYYTASREPIQYLGKIDNGVDYNHHFYLSKNVKSTIAGCGCVTVEISISNPKIVKSTFHGIANYKGPFVKNITVTYEDGTTETLSLKGELK